MFRRVTHSLALLLSLGFSRDIWGEDPSFVARISRYRGTVTVTDSSGKASPVDRVGLRLFEGQRIETGEGSLANVLMVDDTLFQMGPHSIFHLERVSLGGEGEGRRALYSMLRGKLRSIFVKETTDRDDLTLKTPAVSMGVRGTEILTDVYRTEAGEDKTDVALMEGRLAVLVAGQSRAIEMNPGDILRVAGLDVGDIRHELGKLREDVFRELNRLNREGEGPFLHDVLRDRQPSLFNGKKSDFRFDETADKGQAGRLDIVKKEQLPKVLEKIKRQSRAATPKEIAKKASGKGAPGGGLSQASKGKMPDRISKVMKEKEKEKKKVAAQVPKIPPATPSSGKGKGNDVNKPPPPRPPKDDNMGPSSQ